jgi:hypothetical protein
MSEFLNVSNFIIFLFFVVSVLLFISNIFNDKKNKQYKENIIELNSALKNKMIPYNFDEDFKALMFFINTYIRREMEFVIKAKYATYAAGNKGNAIYNDTDLEEFTLSISSKIIECLSERYKEDILSKYIKSENCDKFIVEIVYYSLITYLESHKNKLNI